MFGFLFVPSFHVEQREIRVNQLFFGTQLFGFVTFGDGGGEIALSIKRHTERELSVEVRRFTRENGAQFGDAAVVITAAEIEHSVVVLFLGGAHQSLRCVVRPRYTAQHDDEFANQISVHRFRRNVVH